MQRHLNAFRGMVAFLLLGSAGLVGAVSLDEAKSQGLVGETMEGYVAVVEGSAGAEVQAMVDEVNEKRRAEYQRIAEQHGITVEQVEALAAKKAIEKTRTGGWVRVDGTWRRK